MAYLGVDGSVKYNFYTPVTYIKGRTTHEALDIIVPKSMPITMIVPGEVLKIIDVYGEQPNEGFGNEAWVLYDTGIVGRYCHILKGSFKVKVGQTLDIGDTIAMVGRSGYVSPKTVYHTHYEEYKDINAYNAYQANHLAKNVRIDPLTSNNQAYMGRLEDLEKRVYTDHENSLGVLHKNVNKMKDNDIPDLKEKHKVQAGKIKELEKGHKNQAKAIKKLESN